MDEAKKEALRFAVIEKARRFAANPQQGRAEGYQPIQKFIPNPEFTGSLDGAPRIPVRDDFSAWLHGIAPRDLRGLEWRIIESPEQNELVIF